MRTCLRFVGVDDDSLDFGAEFCHLGFEIFVAAVKVVNAADFRFTFGDEGGEDERGGGAQVGTHDVGTFKRESALDGGGIAAERNACTKAFHFGNMLKAVVIDGILDHAIAGDREERCHERCLHVGGVAREGERLDSNRLEFYATGIDFGPVGSDTHLAVHVAEGVECRGDVFGDNLGDFHAATRNGGTTKEGACFDTVGNGDAITRA